MGLSTSDIFRVGMEISHFIVQSAEGPSELGAAKCVCMHGYVLLGFGLSSMLFFNLVS